MSVRGIGRVASLVGVAAVMVMCGVLSVGPVPPSDSGPAAGTAATVAPTAVTAAGLEIHLRALEEITRANGGQRAVGSVGYDAAADYVGRVLTGAGYRVTRDELEAPTFIERATFLGIAGGPPGGFVEGRDFRIAGFSGAGDVQGPLVAVDVSCTGGTTAPFPTGAIALVRAVGCDGLEWLPGVIAAGPAAVLVRTSYTGEEIPRLLLPGGATVPVAQVSAGAAAALDRARREAASSGGAGMPSVRVLADVEIALRRTGSVIGELPGTDADRILIVGAHLDGCVDGPAIEDDGSGVAAVLEIARLLAARRPAATVRIALWSGEEVGLLGSAHYVAGLAPAERARIVAYLNADVIGARNGIRAVEAPRPGDAVGEALATRLSAAFGALPSERIDVAGSTDTWSFASAGIPATGILSFTLGPKTVGQAERYGGTAGDEPDSCYHRSCDDLANVDLGRATELAQALAAVGAALVSP